MIIKLLNSIQNLNSFQSLQLNEINFINEWLKSDQNDNNEEDQKKNEEKRKENLQIKEELCNLINLWPWFYSNKIQFQAVREAKQLMLKLW